MRESRGTAPGERAVVTETPFGKLGLTVCYDMRFPALYQTLADLGAVALAVPSAFFKNTGRAHWHVLLRARANRMPVLRARRRRSMAITAIAAASPMATG